VPAPHGAGSYRFLRGRTMLAGMQTNPRLTPLPFLVGNCLAILAVTLDRRTGGGRSRPRRGDGRARHVSGRPIRARAQGRSRSRRVSPISQASLRALSHRARRVRAHVDVGNVFHRCPSPVVRTLRRRRRRSRELCSGRCIRRLVSCALGALPSRCPDGPRAGLRAGASVGGRRSRHDSIEE
jgi:hypothetical protein